MPDPLTITAAGAWAWDKYGKSLTDRAASALKGRWDKFRWNEAAEKYRTKVKKLYGTMQIMGMAEPVPLDNIFTEAYLLDKPTAFNRFDIARLKQASADPDAPPPNAKRVTGLSLVKKNRNLFVLGKPGAGKTTFLKYIAVQAAEPDKPVINKVPIFVSLKQWTDSGKELLQFIEERFDICDFPEARPFAEELLKYGGAIVLFDGLDEVNQEGGQRDRQIREMNNFIEKYDRTQCLITCRLAANDYSFKPFTYVEIADFTPKQIETFVSNWFRNQEGEKDEETSERFLAEFEKTDNKGLRDLARTPLLLTLLCLSFNETLTFPQRRVEIYKEALDALLKKWDSSRRIKRDDVYRKLSLGHKENMLARIAAETFERNQYFIPQSELERLITNYVKNVPPHDTNELTDGETILKAVESQHGIFVERANKVYSFSHLTFQEYFTAKYLVDNAAQGALRNLVKAHSGDSRWREVFLLTASLLPDAAQFMRTFRQGVDELLGSDVKLKELLSWAAEKSEATRPDSWSGRLNYLFVELNYQIRNNAFHQALFNAIDQDDFHELNIQLDRTLLRSLLLTDHITNRFRGNEHFNELTERLSSDLAFCVARGHHVGEIELERELGALSMPTAEATTAEWRDFARKFRLLVLKYRNVGHEWELSKRQESRLFKYINAIHLLKSCLELAVISPNEKRSIQNSLYLPPGQVGGVEVACERD